MNKTNVNFDSYTKTAANLPQDNVFTNVSALIGNQPAITFPTNGSSDPSVIHGVTIREP